MRKILIFGANSAIAQAVARRFAQHGHIMYLVGRDPVKLAAIAADLRVRTKAEIYTQCADLDIRELHKGLIEDAKQEMAGLDTVLIAHGLLGQQELAQGSVDQTMAIINTNLLSPISILTHVATEFSQSGHGTIAVITSVAGDRGRASNYIYGTAKGALSIFLSGLRNRLAGVNVAVIDLKLGIVDTPMTRDLQKGRLWATPASIAISIEHAIENSRDVAYIPGFWLMIMLIILIIPERIFKHLKI